MAKATAKQNEKKSTRHCPFCDVEIYELHLPICSACHTAIVYCPECNEPLPKNQQTCPVCGKKTGKK